MPKYNEFELDVQKVTVEEHPEFRAFESRRCIGYSYGCEE